MEACVGGLGPMSPQLHTAKARTVTTKNDGIGFFIFFASCSVTPPSATASAADRESQPAAVQSSVQSMQGCTPDSRAMPNARLPTQNRPSQAKQDEAARVLNPARAGVGG